MNESINQSSMQMVINHLSLRFLGGLVSPMSPMVGAARSPMVGAPDIGRVSGIVGAACMYGNTGGALLISDVGVFGICDVGMLEICAMVFDMSVCAGMFMLCCIGIPFIAVPGIAMTLATKQHMLELSEYNPRNTHCAVELCWIVVLVCLSWNCK